MTTDASPGRPIETVGAVGMITTIIAARCNDEGVAISCADCGHVFVESVPLADESEPARNIDLARELWIHMCDQPGRRSRKPVSTGKQASGKHRRLPQ